eukprot:EG_transcript_17292
MQKKILKFVEIAEAYMGSGGDSKTSTLVLEGWHLPSRNPPAQPQRQQRAQPSSCFKQTAKQRTPKRMGEGTWAERSSPSPGGHSKPSTAGPSGPLGRLPSAGPPPAAVAAAPPSGRV